MNNVNHKHCCGICDNMIYPYKEHKHKCHHYEVYFS